MATSNKTENEFETQAVTTEEVTTEQVAAKVELEHLSDGAPAASETAVAAAQPSGWQKFCANTKERFRKFLVNLKRNPQRIPLVCFVIVSFIWLLWLFTFSQTGYTHSTIKYVGLALFVNTLLSVLILALFFNAFPKRKKPNIIMLALMFVFIAIIICMDVLFYIQVKDFIDGGGINAEGLAQEPFVLKSLTYAIAHIVLIGFCAVVLALYPVYKRLLLKINTKKEVADNNIKEQIDIEDEE